MRTMVPIILTATLAACSPTANLQQAGTAPMGTNRLADMLSGRAAGSAVSCLPAGRQWETASVDGAITFRRGSQLYVGTFEGGGCRWYGRPGYALVTRHRGPGLCRGDIAWIMHSSTGEIVGSCMVGPFVPYSAVSKWE